MMHGSTDCIAPGGSGDPCTRISLPTRHHAMRMKQKKRPARHSGRAGNCSSFFWVEKKKKHLRHAPRGTRGRKRSKSEVGRCTMR